MEIAEGALAMAAKHKINTKIAGLAKPQTTKRTQKIKLKKHLPAHVATNELPFTRFSAKGEGN